MQQKSGQAGLMISSNTAGGNLKASTKPGSQLMSEITEANALAADAPLTMTEKAAPKRSIGQENTSYLVLGEASFAAAA